MQLLSKSRFLGWSTHLWGSEQWGEFTVLAPRSEIAGSYDGGQQRRWIADDLWTRMVRIKMAATRWQCRTIDITVPIAVTIIVGGDPYPLGMERPTPSFVQ